MIYKKQCSLILSLVLMLGMTVSGFANAKIIKTSEKNLVKSELPPIITVRVNGSPRLPAGTEVRVSIGGDCDKADVVTITIGPTGGGTARVDMNGCRPTGKTYAVANALVGPSKDHYYGKGPPIGTGGASTTSVTIRPV